jgi:hypothetical protein
MGPKLVDYLLYEPEDNGILWIKFNRAGADERTGRHRRGKQHGLTGLPKPSSVRGALT